jgi:hypothetical protein
MHKVLGLSPSTERERERERGEGRKEGRKKKAALMSKAAN